MFWSEAVSSGPQFFYLAPWIVFFPVIGLLINMIFGGRMGEKAVGIVASAGCRAVLYRLGLAGHFADQPSGRRDHRRWQIG